MLYPLILIGLAALVQAGPQLKRHTTFSGVATFNDFKAQGKTVCGPLTASNPNHFGAASGDISRNISTGRCDGPLNPDPSKCNKKTGTPLDVHYVRPACPKTAAQCAKPTCFRVRNTGAYGSKNSSPTGSAIVVQIIDSCPAGHAQNYCKAYNSDPAQIVPAQERCGDPSTNYLDIDLHAYTKLTGGAWISGQSPNLKISIDEVDCATEKNK